MLPFTSELSHKTRPSSMITKPLKDAYMEGLGATLHGNKHYTEFTSLPSKHKRKKLDPTYTLVFVLWAQTQMHQDSNHTPWDNIRVLPPRFDFAHCKIQVWG